MKMYMPIHKRLKSIGTTEFEDEESQHFIWGYYSDTLAPSDVLSAVGLKRVCLYNDTVSRIYKYNSTLVLTPDLRHAPTPADFSAPPGFATLNNQTAPYDKYFVLGGLQYVTGAFNCATFQHSDVFKEFLKVKAQNFDGNGNDAVAGFKGVFVNSLNLSDNDDFIRIEGWVIPDVLPSSGKIKAFKRTVLAGAKKIDRPDCTQLESQGFVGTGSQVNPNSFWNFSIDTDISTGDAEAGQIEVVLCPIFSGNLLSPIGAIHLDSERMRHLDP